MIEVNCDDILHYVALFVCCEVCKREGCLWYWHWYCNLRHSHQILVSKTLYESLDRNNLFSLHLTSRNLFSNLFVCHGDGRKCIRYGLSSDLISGTISPVPYSWCKISEDGVAFAGRDIVEVVQEKALYESVCPVFSILFPSFGSLCSDAIGNGMSRKEETTHNANFLATLYSRHYCICGKG